MIKEGWETNPPVLLSTNSCSTRTKRALMELDLRSGKSMSFREFIEIAIKLPNVFFPAYDLQRQLKEKVLLMALKSF